MLRPEKLVDPDTFPTLVQYLTAMRGPVSPLLPSYWAAETLGPLLAVRKGQRPVLSAHALEHGGRGLCHGRMGLQQDLLYRMVPVAGREKRPPSRAPLLPTVFSQPFAAVPGKHARHRAEGRKAFFRDTSQWSQLFLLFALMVVYIYSFKLLPLERAAMPSFYLQNLISFLNLGMVGFVTSAVAVRFVFPAVSLEGASFWIIRSAPLSIRDFLWAKFWSSLLPLLLLSETADRPLEHRCSRSRRS